MAKYRGDGWNLASRSLASRRRFLQMLGWTGMESALGGAGLFSPFTSRIRADNAASVFEEIPASASGISWVHVSGRSAMAHLPETVGAGCAFLDYDNDGWTSIW
jgi:hypothetical protein